MMQKVLEVLSSLLILMPRIRGRDRLLFLLLRHVSRARTYYGPVIRPRVEDWTNRACFVGLYGNELSDLIRDMPENGIFLDIGANVGIFSLLASTKLESGKVFAFEPNIFVYQDLLENINLNNAENITPFNCGIADSRTDVPFSFSFKHTGAGKISRNQGGASNQRVMLENFNTISPSLDLSSERYCLCKIDTEGSELQVLKTLEKSGAFQFIDCFFIEICDEHLREQGAYAKSIYVFLQSHGFQPMKGISSADNYDEIFHQPRSWIGRSNYAIPV